MLLADVGSVPYKIVYVLHIVAVVVGFGGVVLSGIATRTALERKGPEGGAIAAANSRTAAVAAYSLYSVPVWGIFLIILSDDQFTFAQPWVSASFTLFIVGVALMLGVLRPAMKRFDVAVADPAKAEEAEKLGTMLAVAGGVVSLIWVVIVVLMVFKPGL